jgi:hypothetical protein
LPEEGRWTRGVGAFSEKPALLCDRIERAAGKPSKLPSLAVYDDTCVGRILAAGMKYPGSSGLVFRLLARRDVSLRFHLWEADRAAFDDLTSHYRQASNVSVYHGDGYAGVAGLEAVSLALVDPPGIDGAERNQVQCLLKHLTAKGIPFMCWTARLATVLADRSEESNNSRQFYEMAAQARWPVCRITWPSSRGWTCGCQLTVSPGIAEVVARTAGELCRLMDWELAVDNQVARP